ncbi:UBX domain-containing protein 8-like [Mytilus galloprovincialis]|uniref:UBX domain-containing protein 8-like n=1 Tax=Mytilus galloprovincialis TaxID=29158 RepID=UPI003F7CCC54
MEFMATVLVLMSSAFLFVYFQAEPWMLIQILVKALLLLACLTFVIQFVGKRMWIMFSHYKSQPTKHEPNDNEHKKEQEVCREKIQKDYQIKTEAYKEKILIPREEAKKRQKEEEHYRFLGPAWKGKGEVLGGDVQDSDEQTDEVRFRRLEENINEEYLEQVRQEQEREAKRKQRKKIILPKEPEENDPDSLQIVLRSPLGQNHTRRFLYSNTLQVILDYITTLGFNQRRYTLCTTYPRQALSDQRELTLSELKFTKRTTLNIEEIL